MRVYFNKKVHDYPKRAGDCYLAWYNQGNICILKKKPLFVCQSQHLKIQTINQISLKLWAEQSQRFKKDMAEYAKRYKKKYPGLRKRGISAYSAFLMVVHALIRRFHIQYENHENAINIMSTLIKTLSVKKAIRLRLIKPVSDAYQLNQSAGNDQHVLYIHHEKSIVTKEMMMFEEKQQAWYYP